MGVCQNLDFILSDGWLLIMFGLLVSLLVCYFVGIYGNMGIWEYGNMGI